MAPIDVQFFPQFAWAHANCDKLKLFSRAHRRSCFSSCLGSCLYVQFFLKRFSPKRCEMSPKLVLLVFECSYIITYRSDWYGVSNNDLSHFAWTEYPTDAQFFPQFSFRLSFFSVADWIFSSPNAWTDVSFFSSVLPHTRSVCMSSCKLTCKLRKKLNVYGAHKLYFWCTLVSFKLTILYL